MIVIHVQGMLGFLHDGTKLYVRLLIPSRGLTASRVSWKDMKHRQAAAQRRHYAKKKGAA